MTYIELGYIGLFIACFLSATLIPFASEGVFVYFLLNGFDPYISLGLATAGNTLGGLTNYGIGLIGREEQVRKRLKKPQQFDQFSNWVKRYGSWLGFLSWVPIIGDPLTIMLGFFRVSFIPTLMTIALGKFTRYFIILYFAL